MRNFCSNWSCLTKTQLRFLWLGLVLLLAFGVLINGCVHLPKTPHLAKSVALTQKVTAIKADTQTQSTLTTGHLSQAIGEQTLAHPNLSGYYPIATGANAFAARSILSDKATSSIDIQYYIWHNDEAGQLMLKDLWQAAQRGVVVRLLLDDFNGSAKLDDILVRFASHPNIAVRLVNPVAMRHWRGLNFTLEPKRINVRMHNKSMTFDRRLSIIGGRNIGNEYLNNDKNNNFADLDVLLVGKVVGNINDSFDQYWNLPVAYDIESLVAVPDGFKPHHFLDSLDKIDTQAYHKADESQRVLRTYRSAVQSSTIGDDLLAKRLAFRWAMIDFLDDNANKIIGKHTQNDLLVYKLRQNFGIPKSHLSMISSYFVPTKKGVDGLIALAKQGVKVRILTNSYNATDVGLVHAGYAHWRKALLQAGIEIYELKSTAEKSNKQDNRLWRTPGQTTTALHAKAFAVDTHKVFIGSYNIDPRSANINSELGVMIYDNLLAQRLHDAFGEHLLSQAYKVQLQQDQLTWHTIENGESIILTQEPHMQTGDKIGIHFIGYLPIDWLL